MTNKLLIILNPFPYLHLLDCLHLLRVSGVLFEGVVELFDLLIIQPLIIHLSRLSTFIIQLKFAKHHVSAGGDVSQGRLQNQADQVVYSLELLGYEGNCFFITQHQPQYQNSCLYNISLILKFSEIVQDNVQIIFILI